MISDLAQLSRDIVCVCVCVYVCMYVYVYVRPLHGLGHAFEIPPLYLFFSLVSQDKMSFVDNVMHLMEMGLNVRLCVCMCYVCMGVYVCACVSVCVCYVYVCVHMYVCVLSTYVCIHYWATI